MGVAQKREGLCPEGLYLVINIVGLGILVGPVDLDTEGAVQIKVAAKVDKNPQRTIVLQLLLVTFLGF